MFTTTAQPTGTADAAKSPPRGEGFLAGLCSGRFRWDVIHPFPRQDRADRAVGDRVLSELGEFLRHRVDPEQIERAGRMPDDLVEELKGLRYLGLRMDRAKGGLALSFTNAFRVIEAAMSWSVPVGWFLAIQNGLGAGAYLPLLPDGPLRDLISRRVEARAIFGDADTEPSGAANELRTTTARLTADGSAYLIDGEKICIGNGPIADFLAVSATVNDADGERVEYFFTDTATPGFGVRSRQEFLGLKGAAIGALVFDQVRIPSAQMLVLPDAVDTEFEVNRPARMYIVSAPALAIAKLCARWSREFVNRRRIDGQPLGSYDAIQQIVAATLADVFAIESVAEWCLLGEERQIGDDFRLEQSAAKNITSLACWRVVDRTVSLLGAEGLESSRSKADRDAPPLPVERAFRDARALRVAGGVDFLLDKYFGETVVLARVAQSATDHSLVATDHPPRLMTVRNQAHFHFLREAIAGFPDTCRQLRTHRPVGDRVPILANRIANEIFTMSATLSRAATLSSEGHSDVQDLADIYCVSARRRIEGWRTEAAEEADYSRAARRWLEVGEPKTVTADVVGRALGAESGDD